MEAIFESVPEAVLQLVYIMRVGTSTITYKGIFIVSIVQSIISMANSILNNDYTRMKEDKWAKYKQRLPPTFEFFKHAICRLSEIIYRIGLLALFWTVCGGMAFTVLIGIELFLISFQTMWLVGMDNLIFDADTIFLAMSSFIVIPSEEVYGIVPMEWHAMFGSSMSRDDSFGEIAFGCAVILSMNVCCCIGAASVLASVSLLCTDGGAGISLPPLIRIGTSLYEIIFLLIWAFVGKNGTREDFLLKKEHGLVIFIVTCVCFVIFAQYRILFPDFALPLSVGVRSKWGYAFANELTELQKINVPLKRMPYRSKRKSRNLEGESLAVNFGIDTEGHFWDEPYTFYESDKPITAAMFALAKGNHEIVQWLEDHGAVVHKNVEQSKINQLIYPPPPDDDHR
eukprot:1033156_1